VWDGLQSAHKHTTKMPPSSSHPAKFSNLCESQQEIGWGQLFHGRFGCLWGQAFESATTHNNSEIKVGGPQWTTEVTVAIWRHVSQLRGSRNEDHHGRSQAEKETKECQKLLQHKLKACACCDSNSRQWLQPMHLMFPLPTIQRDLPPTCADGFPSAAHTLKNR